MKTQLITQNIMNAMYKIVMTDLIQLALQPNKIRKICKITWIPQIKL